MRTRSAVRGTAAALVVVALVGAGAPAEAAGHHVLAATGDSLSRAFDVDDAHSFQDAPAKSWSTGTDRGVRSLRLRLGSSTTAHNDAATGAMMRDLDDQLALAAGQQADRVTIQMGANDVCTSSIRTMTSTATFKRQFDTALRRFTAKRPKALVSVSSIPDLYQLWSLLHTKKAAKDAWAMLGECRPMLSSSATAAQRRRVLAQIRADNAALAAVCRTHRTCRWDGGAVFAMRFTAAQVSTVDYFHPSTSGQAKLAATVWATHPFG